jgi:chromosome segregation ATPase
LLRSTANDLVNQLDNLRLQLETTRTALKNEENTTKILKDNLAEIVAKNEKTQMRIKEVQESDKGTVIKLKRDLDEATAIQKTRERDIEALTIKNKAVVAELNLANQSRTQSDQQVRLLADKLKKVQTELNNERSLHQAGDKKIDALMETIHLTEQDLRTTVEERNKLIDLLENERKLRVPSEDRSHQKARKEREHIELEFRVVPEEPARLENDRVLMNQNREKASEPVSNSQKSLIKPLNVLTNERIQTEQVVKDLTDKRDPAKNAIVDKEEDFMRHDDLFVSVSEESQVLKQSFLMEETAGIQKEDVPDIPVKKAKFPEIVESPYQTSDEVTMSDTQKSPGSEKERTSPKLSSQNPELFPKAVTDIINTFNDDDLF